MAEPGAFAARRIAGQAHYGVPQFWRSVPPDSYARLGQELAGIGPVAGRGVEIAGVAGTVKVSSIWASLDGKAGLWGYRGT